MVLSQCISFLVLEDIEPDKVYVLGGLVDESIHKVRGACPVSRDIPVLGLPPPSLFPQILPGPSSELGETAAAWVPQASGQGLALWLLRAGV